MLYLYSKTVKHFFVKYYNQGYNLGVLKLKDLKLSLKIKDSINIPTNHLVS